MSIPAHQPGQSGYEGHKPGKDGTAVSLMLAAIALTAVVSATAALLVAALLTVAIMEGLVAITQGAAPPDPPARRQADNPSDFPGFAGEGLKSLCAVTGMEFAPKPNNSGYGGAYGYSGTGGHHAAATGSQQWCSGCSSDGTHRICGFVKKCFLDPRNEINVPASVWTDKTRLDAITKGRDDNARKIGISAGKLIPPTAEAIKLSLIHI